LHFVDELDAEIARCELSYAAWAPASAWQRLPPTVACS
jgi:hypothetical protein